MNVNNNELITNADEEIPKNLEVDNTIKVFGKNFHLTKAQLTTTVLLVVYFFLSSAYYSLFAPFFPAESVKKGISQTQVGIIFGVFEFVLLVLSPVFGKYVICSLNESSFSNNCVFFQIKIKSLKF
jgi:hypothetical protein